LVEAVARTLHGYELIKQKGATHTSEDFEAWREKYSPHWVLAKSNEQVLQVNLFKCTVDGLVGNIMNAVDDLDVEG